MALRQLASRPIAGKCVQVGTCFRREHINEHKMPFAMLVLVRRASKNSRIRPHAPEIFFQVISFYCLLGRVVFSVSMKDRRARVPSTRGVDLSREASSYFFAQKRRNLRWLAPSYCGAQT
jgi:hypothetical protein